ncbi:MAG: YggT family protein [Gammaproteobacteria bacterium]|nr:YggT family protein [Gammaproteobacteria bacterium]
MGSDYLSNPLVFLIQVLFGLYILVVMLRFLLQLTRADFYNPVSQIIVKATSPLLNPLRRVVPGFAGIDLAAIVLMWLVQSLELALIVMISGMGSNLAATLAWAIPELVNLALNVFLFAILIQVILSWVSPGTYNPALSLIHSLTEPVLRPAQRLIPPISGLDLSPMVVMVGLTLLKMLLLPPLQMLTGTPFR